MWNRLIIPAELRDPNGNLLSAAANPSIALVRKGAEYLGNGSPQTILAGQTDDITVINPGELTNGDTLIVADYAETGAVGKNSGLQLQQDPYRNNDNEWVLTVKNVAGDITLARPTVFMLFPNATSVIPHSATSDGASPSTSLLSLSAARRAEVYIEEASCDFWGMGTPTAILIPNVGATQLTNRSVFEFGAIGDGATDDTAAIQRAIDAVSENGGGIVHVPTGNYLIYDTLNVPSGITLRGEGGQAQHHVTQITAMAAINMIAALGEYDGNPYMDNFGLENVLLDGNEHASLGVHIRAGRVCHITGCSIIRIKGTAYLADQVWDSWYRDCLFDAPIEVDASPMVHIYAGSGGGASNGQHFHNCRFGGFIQTVPLRIEGALPATNDLIFISECLWESREGAPRHIEIINTVRVFIQSCSLGQWRVENPSGDYLVYIKDSQEIMIDNLHVQYNPPANPGPALPVLGLDNAQGITIKGGSIVLKPDPTNPPYKVISGDSRGLSIQGVIVREGPPSFALRTDVNFVEYLQGATSAVQQNLLNELLYINGREAAPAVFFQRFADSGTDLGIWSIGRISVNSDFQVIYGLQGAEDLAFTLEAQNYAARFFGRILEANDAGQLFAFGDGDSTPSVVAGNAFRTQNTNPTTITFFDDGSAAHRLVVVVGDNNTTFANSATLHLADGQDFVASQNDTLTLISNGTAWYELSRSHNG